MVKQKFLKLIKDGEITSYRMKFPKGTEFEIINDIVYISGFPVSGETQKIIYDWLIANMGNRHMFIDNKRRYMI